MTHPPEKDTSLQSQGIIAWMVNNRVTPNLLMLVLLIGGFFMSLKIKKEVFPNFELDLIIINVAYPGASPSEVEQGIILAIEEAISGNDALDEVTSTANEGRGQVLAELLEGSDERKAYQEIKQEIDRITTFPEDAEEPQVTLTTRRRFVVTVMLYGDAREGVLRELSEQARDKLLQNPNISQVDLFGVRDHEIQISVSRENLRIYRLTLDGIARKIEQSAVEIPGGSIETKGGEILLRMRERRDWAREFARIPIVSTPSGTILYLGDIANVRDDFEEIDRITTYNGKPATTLEVFRVGNQSPISVSDAVRETLGEIEQGLPPGLALDVNIDRSDAYRQRLELLLRNGFMGLLFVLIILGMFLEIRLAFWVMMGIPTSFLGAMLFLPSLGVSINMVSMFAFIIALGIVVDDAIIAGENIYEYRQKGMGRIEAAIQGAKDITVPVGFSILTNLVAFSPLYFVPGIVGKIFQILPLVVGSIFLISWFEALFILPAHLAHTRSREGRGVIHFLNLSQHKFSAKLTKFVEKIYAPFVGLCIRNRYLTVAVSAAFFFIILGYAFSGRMGFVLFPKIEADRAVATARLPFGSPITQSIEVRDQLIKAANEIAEKNGGEALVEGLLGTIAENEIVIQTYLSGPDIRPIDTATFIRLWREKTGQITGLESLRFESDRGGPGSGASLTIELSHRNVNVLERASKSLALSLTQFEKVKDIDAGFTPGKQQMDLKLLPEGDSLGLTSSEVARQVRNAFFGAEALRQQRGRNEVKVKVRLPESQRTSEFDLEHLLIRTPAGRDVPLHHVAEITRGRAYTTITHLDGRRTINVTANVEPRRETNQVLKTLKSEVLPRLSQDYPGLSYGFEGKQADMRESMQSLGVNFMVAMMGVFMLLVIPFRSYIQPLIVMAAIPFGILGAVIGHIVMGFSLSVISMMGIVALSGVVVNDALVLIDYANFRRDEGALPIEAIQLACIRRFRPIFLTTVTTFGGLAPMIFESSRQARFIIPMAISLGYGILFATVITLLIVPCLYLILEDIFHLARDRSKPPERQDAHPSIT